MGGRRAGSFGRRVDGGGSWRLAAGIRVFGRSGRSNIRRSASRGGGVGNGGIFGVEDAIYM